MLSYRLCRALKCLQPNRKLGTGRRKIKSGASIESEVLQWAHCGVAHTPQTLIKEWFIGLVQSLSAICPLNENHFLLPFPLRSLVNQVFVAKIQAGQCITDGKLLKAIILVRSVGGGVICSLLCRHTYIYLACVGGIKSVCQGLGDHFLITLSMHS